MCSQLRTTAVEAESDRQQPHPSGRTKITPTTLVSRQEPEFEPARPKKTQQQDLQDTETSPPQQCFVSPRSQVYWKNAGV